MAIGFGRMDLVKNGSNFIFSVQLHNGKEDKYIKLELIDTSNNNVTVYMLNHIQGGRYEKKDLIANSDGYFLARYTVFKDIALTNQDMKYNIKLESIRVESIVNQLENIIDYGDGSAS